MVVRAEVAIGFIASFETRTDLWRESTQAPWERNRSRNINRSDSHREEHFNLHIVRNANRETKPIKSDSLSGRADNKQSLTPWFLNHSWL